MRGPFPVRYPVRQSTRYLAVLVAAILASGLTLGSWGWSQWDVIARQPLRWVLLTAVVCWLGWSGWLLWRWAMQIPQELIWDGQCWWLTPEGVDAPPSLKRAPVVVLDVGTSVWLRISVPGQPLRWDWLDRSSAPRRWADLRRAVYSRARPESATQAEAGRNCADEA